MFNVEEAARKYGKVDDSQLLREAMISLRQMFPGAPDPICIS